MDQDVTWYEGKRQPRREATLCYIGIQLSPPPFGPCLLWPNGRQSQLLLSTCYIYVIANVLTVKTPRLDIPMRFMEGFLQIF